MLLRREESGFCGHQGTEYGTLNFGGEGRRGEEKEKEMRGEGRGGEGTY